MEEDEYEPRPHLRLAVENDQRAIDKQRAIDAIRQPLRKLATNLLRVVRGAGRSYQIVYERAELVEAFQHYREAVGCWPSSFEIDEILSFRKPMTQFSEQAYATDVMLRGSLQMVASRLAGQHTQECAGESELFSGLNMIEEQRKKDEMRRLQKAPPRPKMPATVIRATPRPATTPEQRSEQTQIKKRSKPDPKTPPSYAGLKRYKPTEEERAEFRINSVDELVALANKYLISAGKWPLSQGDFPINKSAFEKVAKIVRAFQTKTN